MIIDDNLITTILLKETIDLILTRSSLKIKNSQIIDILINDIDELKTNLKPSFIIGGIKGINTIIDLTHCEGITRFRSVIKSLEFEHKKELNYTSRLEGKKIDFKHLIKYVNHGGSVTKLEKVRTIKKAKYYEKYYR